MEQIYIVMGGSFNPPTLAHQRLLSGVVEKTGAVKGIFLPSCHSYVAKKMSKAESGGETLPEALRLSMLETLASEDSRLAVDDYEYHCEETPRTFTTLLALQEKYPDATLYFLVGGDKLSVLPRWHRIEEFLEKFHILVVKREGDLPENALSRSALLTKYRDRFHIIDAPDGIDGISSTVAREMMETGDPSLNSVCHEGVIALWREYLEKQKTAVKQFREEYFFLSNFYEAPITYGGLTYGSNEAAFQAQKCLSEEERRSFTELSPSQAKKRGRAVSLRPDWEQVKLGLMEEIVYAKFSQNEELRDLLLATGDRVLIEGNTWNDTFWGVSLKSGNGQNHLGKILMKVRKRILDDVACGKYLT